MKRILLSLKVGEVHLEKFGMVKLELLKVCVKIWDAYCCGTISRWIDWSLVTVFSEDGIS